MLDELARRHGVGDRTDLAAWAPAIDLPDAEAMEAFDTLEVDVTSLCPDPDELEFGNCGAWDYLAWLYVYSENDETIEMARFITSYHRETRWVVDVSPMLVHLRGGGKRKFRWEFAPPWNPQPTATRLSLRLSSQGKAVKPAEATFLWSGGTFDSKYAEAHPPKEVLVPADAAKIELWAIVTGHGAEAGQCAEFCNHQHRFDVNGKTYLLAHPEAGTLEGCIDEIENGMVPNQGGTWWFGRGGWCPGQQVEPWVVDVTADVKPGEMAKLGYKGLFKMKPPSDGAGNIEMTSYLVTYR